MTVLRPAILFFLLFIAEFSWATHDESAVVVVQEICIVGNRKTKESIIFRELTFRVGDSLSGRDLELALAASVRNLLNQPLFHFVRTEILKGDSPGKVRVQIYVTERWYMWVWPVFEISDRNFNTWLEHGDLSRLSYGLFFQQENFRGRLEKLHIRLKLGYQQQIALLYDAPYLNRSKTLGAGVSLAAGRQREVGYITLNDKLQYFRGSDFMLEELDLAVFARYRPDIHISHTMQLRYNQLHMNDSLLALNPDYSTDGSTDKGFAEFSYLVKADFRDQRAYPLRGWYCDAEFARYGLFRQDDFGFFTIRPTFRVHFPLASRWYAALGAAAGFSAGGEIPYYLNRTLGYRRDYVRGYEYYVTEGRNFWLFKSNVKYALLQPGVKKIAWIKSGKFNTIPYALFLSAFADVGRAWPGQNVQVNPLQGKTHAGIGLGLDFITYYDKVVRMEFSFNGKGESGLFLHFMAAI